MSAAERLPVEVTVIEGDGLVVRTDRHHGDDRVGDRTLRLELERAATTS